MRCLSQSCSIRSMVLGDIVGACKKDLDQRTQCRSVGLFGQVCGLLLGLRPWQNDCDQLLVLWLSALARVPCHRLPSGLHACIAQPVWISVLWTLHTWFVPGRAAVFLDTADYQWHSMNMHRRTPSWAVWETSLQQRFVHFWMSQLQHEWVAVMRNDPSQPSRDGLPSCWTEENQFVFSDCDYHLWDCVHLLALWTTDDILVTVCMGCCDEKWSVPAKQRWLAIMLNGRKSVCILWLWLPLVRLCASPCFMNNWCHSGDCMHGLLWWEMIRPSQAEMACHHAERKKISLYSLTVTTTCEIVCSSLLYEQLMTFWWLYAWVAVMRNDPSAKQRWLAIMLNGRKSVCILWLWLPLVRLCAAPCFTNNWWHSGDCMLLWGKLIHHCQADMVCHNLNG